MRCIGSSNCSLLNEQELFRSRQFYLLQTPLVMGVAPLPQKAFEPVRHKKTGPEKAGEWLRRPGGGVEPEESLF